MGSPHGFDAGLEFDELQNVVDRGSGAVTVGTRLTNAATNLGQQSLLQTGSATSLTNSITTPQDVFSGGRTVTLQANTFYAFEGVVAVQTGATSHTEAFSWVASTALASIDYDIFGFYSAGAGTLVSAFGTSIDVHVATAVVATGALTTNTYHNYQFEGVLKTGNAATTLKLQITFSAGPTGTCQVNTGSYLLFYPIVSQ